MNIHQHSMGPFASLWMTRGAVSKLLTLAFLTTAATAASAEVFEGHVVVDAQIDREHAAVAAPPIPSPE